MPVVKTVTSCLQTGTCIEILIPVKSINIYGALNITPSGIFHFLTGILENE